MRSLQTKDPYARLVKAMMQETLQKTAPYPET